MLIISVLQNFQAETQAILECHNFWMVAPNKGSKINGKVGDEPVFSKNGLVTTLAWGVDGRVHDHPRSGGRQRWGDQARDVRGRGTFRPEGDSAATGQWPGVATQPGRRSPARSPRVRRAQAARQACHAERVRGGREPSLARRARGCACPRGGHRRAARRVPWRCRPPRAGHHSS